MHRRHLARPAHATSVRRQAARHTLLTTLLATGLLLSAWPLATPAQTPSAAVQRAYDVPPGTLAEALSRYAGQAGVSLSFDASLLASHNSTGLQGRYEVDAGFAALLTGTGWQAVPAGEQGTYVLRRAAPTSMLSPVTVTGASADPAGPYVAHQTTLGRTAQTLRETPQSVHVMTQARMEEQGLTSLTDVLAATPGVISAPTNPIHGPFYIRGHELNSIQFDGISTDFSGGGGNSGAASRTLPNLAMFERVEVQRGASGLFNSTGSPAGAINLVRKRPSDRWRTGLLAEATSFGGYRLEGDTGGPLNETGTVRGRVVLSMEDHRFSYSPGRKRTGLLYGILEADLGPDTLLTVGGSVERLRAVPWINGLARRADGSDPGYSRDLALAPSWNRWDTDVYQGFASLAHRFSPDWQLTLSANYQDMDTDMHYGFVTGAYGSAGPGNARLASMDYVLKSHQLALDLLLEGRYQAFGRSHELILGASTLNQQYRYGSASNAPSIVNIDSFDPNAIPEPPRHDITDLAKNKARQSALFASTRIHLSDPLKLMLGARLSNWRNDSWNAAGMMSGRQRERNVITPYGALTYDFNDQWTAYASVSEIFRPQGQRDASGATLDPVRGRNYEVGLKGTLLDERLNVAMALFRIDEQNRAVLDPANPAPCAGSLTGVDACYVAAGETRSEGVDLEIGGQPLPGWDLVAGYTYNTARYRKDPANDGEQISPLTPRHLLRVWSRYQFAGAMDQWSVGVGVNVQSRTHATAGTVRVTQPGYAVWNARIGYRINDQWSAALQLNNLFDKRYYQRVGAVNGSYYGDPFNAVLTLRGRF